MVNNIKIEKNIFFVLCFYHFCLGLGDGKDITSSHFLNSIATNEILSILSITITIQSLHFSYLIIDKYFPYYWKNLTKITFILLFSTIIRITYGIIEATAYSISH